MMAADPGKGAAMRVRPVGADALLLEVDDPTAWFAELCQRRVAGELAVVDIVPGAQTVLLDGLADPAGVAERVRGWTPPPRPEGPPGALVEIPVAYDGEDLFAVAAQWGVGEGEVIARLGATEFRVDFCGF